MSASVPNPETSGMSAADVTTHKEFINTLNSAADTGIPCTDGSFRNMRQHDQTCRDTDKSALDDGIATAQGSNLSPPQNRPYRVLINFEASASVLSLFEALGATLVVAQMTCVLRDWG